jgi:hypothetical protein
VPEWYDAEGRKVFRPDSRRKSGFKPTFPAGRFLSQPLKYWCSDLGDLRRFLAECKYVSDEEQFGERDYWQPPEQFEENKRGDCEDFALWIWRQLLHMNYSARFALGSASRYGDGRRYWLECALASDGIRCGRRVRVLYLPSGQRYFGCRHCYNLTYDSVRTHDGRVGRLLRNPLELARALNSSNPHTALLGLRAAMKATT